MDLFRSILLAIHDSEEADIELDELESRVLACEQSRPDLDPELRELLAREINSQFDEHVLLLEEAGLLHRRGESRGSLGMARLTNAGHDFVALAADDAAWAKAKRIAEIGARTLCLEVIRTYFAHVAASLGTAAAQAEVAAREALARN